MYFPPYGIYRTIYRRIAPTMLWSIESEDSVFLTFDDGPNVHVTPWVLETLRKYDAKATFFCIGKNAEQHPELVKQILDEGHAIGNHTYSHTKALLSNCEVYVEDVDLANAFLQSNLFRPPYGRLSASKARRLSESYNIIMCDTLSRDYSKYVSRQKCVQEVVPHLKPGAIVAFHDSLKASRNLRYALPRVLDAIADMGLKCKPIVL